MTNQKMLGSSIEIQDYWINKIAPNYFDFENVNNYRSGVFGYINEVMSTVAADAFNAMNIARREFYPITAKYPKSLYKMAALQQLSIPLATPAVCNAVLLLDRDEIIANSTYKNGAYTCIIDNTAKIFADNLQFSLMYPIIIISNESNGVWNHTIHYLKTYSNDLDTENISSTYIVNKTTFQEGKRYLMMMVLLKQYSVTSIPETISNDAMIDNVNFTFNFTSGLANFEVFYTEEPGVSKTIQLKKLMYGQGVVTNPFCYYRLLSNDSLEISFPKNPYFTPMLNAEIRVDIYTCEGVKGNFPLFKGSLSCVMDSETYPYNNNMKMMGVISGGSVKGKDMPTIEEYKRDIQAAYSTNSTITSTSDLQICFDKLSTGRNKVSFRKKRADAFDRIYGAYVLLKDSEDNVIPTNTLTLNLTLNDFDIYNEVSQKAIMLPGAIFEYDPESFTSEIYTGIKSTDLKLLDDLTEYDESYERFLYANPYLISITLDPNSIEYYDNSVDTVISIDHSYMNDQSIIQFIGKNLTMHRNAMNGENFYKISIEVTPSTEIPVESVIKIPTEEDDDYYIRAQHNGVVESIKWEEDMVMCTLLYDDNSRESFQVNSYIENSGGTYEYQTGYAPNFEVYDTFIEGDIIAVKKVEDLGAIRACIDINEALLKNGLYIPMCVEGFNESTSTFTLAGYVSTDDIINDNETILLDHGIYSEDGHEDDGFSIQYKTVKLEVSVFYKYNDFNIDHLWNNFDYLRTHTMTNTYSDNSENGIAVIRNIDFIRSTVLFTEPQDMGPSEETIETPTISEDDDEDFEEEIEEEEEPLDEEVEPIQFNDNDFIICIKEVPLVKAQWIKSSENFLYLSQEVKGDFDNLKLLYYNLENNFGFDMKFYNSYGKSRTFKVGYKNIWEPLSHVNVGLYFGIYIPATGTKVDFIDKFRAYVKELIESINSSASSGQSIYIMNLITDIKNEFKDIGYIEYYGFNNYGTDIQKIEPFPTSEMSDQLIKEYIPEFINISSHKENGVNIPDIYVEFLNQTDQATEQQSYNLRNGGSK